MANIGGVDDNKSFFKSRALNLLLQRNISLEHCSVLTLMLALKNMVKLLIFINTFKMYYKYTFNIIIETEENMTHLNSDYCEINMEDQW